jgi:hypothetical protein
MRSKYAGNTICYHIFGVMPKFREIVNGAKLETIRRSHAVGALDFAPGGATSEPPSLGRVTKTVDLRSGLARLRQGYVWVNPAEAHERSE